MSDNAKVQNALRGVRIGLLLGAVGLAWIVIYYVSGTGLPLPFLGAWNILLGFLLLVAGISGLIGSLIGKAAERKGRSFWTFFWLSILFSPIIMGVIVAVIEPLSDGAVSTGGPGTKKCPECAEFVKEEASVCRFCGNEFNS